MNCRALSLEMLSPVADVDLVYWSRRRGLWEGELKNFHLAQVYLASELAARSSYPSPSSISHHPLKPWQTSTVGRSQNLGVL